MMRENVGSIMASLPAGVALLAASKSQPPEKMAAVIKAGIGILGENYVQEAGRKKDALKELEAEWHFIGHLQSNKVKKAVEIFDCIQAVDSAKLAGEIDKRCRAIGKTMPCLIEVNIGQEETKSGCMPHDLAEIINEAGGMENVRVEGLMCLEPFFEDPEKARPHFREMKRLFERLRVSGAAEMKTLSMGTSGSWRVAVQEGSTMVRLGTAIFGPRPFNPGCEH